MVIPGGVTDLCTSSFGDMHMSDQLTLSAEARERAGKGASRDLRRNGRVPAVIYGDNQEPVMLHVEEKAMNKQQIGRARSEIQSLMRNTYDVFCFKNKTNNAQHNNTP